MVFVEPFEPRTLLTSYYVSPSGNDALAGTSPATAWKTIAKANTVNFDPGDQLLFQGGAAFTAPANSATNQVTDGGFESGNLNSWTVSYDATAGNSAIETNASHVKSGTKSLRVGGSGAGGRGQVVTSKVQANKAYLLKLWAKLSTSGGSATGGVTFRSGGSAGAIVNESKFRISGTSFTQFTASIVAPPSFDYAEVWITKPDSASILYADDVTLNETFGTLVFDATDSGTAAAPVVIGSYGAGRATINAGDGFGLWARDVSGFIVQDLVFTGSWNALAANGNNGAHGVAITNRQAGNTKLNFIRVHNVDASGFKWAGISVSGDNGKSGYTDVRITNCDAHDNGDVGIRVEGTFNGSSTAYAHANVYVAYCKAFNNFGLPNKNSNSGNGILIGDTDGATIERNVAWNNGQNCNHTQGGPVGIWAWDSNAVYIQYNEAYGNKTGSVSLDGAGFDLDGGVTNSFLQYNYSHDNYGAGYLLYQFSNARPFGNNTVRYNISQNDARYGHYAGIYMGGGAAVANNQIYNNTIYITPTSNSSIAAMKIVGIGANNKFRNNIFVTTGGVRVLDSNSAYSTSSVHFQGNNWFSSGASFALKWGGTTYGDLSSWRATGQEKNGSTDTGRAVNPNFVSAGNAPTLGDASKLHTLTNYQLLASSQLINAGLNMSSFGINPGTRDFYGGSIPVGVTDIGAFESSPSANGTVANDLFTFRVGPAGRIELFINTPTSALPTLTWSPGVYATFTINGMGGADILNLDLSNGTPLPSGGATFNGSVEADHLIVTGSAGNDNIAVTSSTVSAGEGGPTLSFSGVGDVSVNTGAGDDTLRVTASGPAAAAVFDLGPGANTLAINAGTYWFNSDAVAIAPNVALTIAAGAQAIFNTSQHLGALTVNGNATLSAGGDKVLVTKSLTIAPTARLDLTNNGLILDYSGASPLGQWNGSAYTGVTGLIAKGRNGGTWNGLGLTASYAAFNPSRYTLGIAEASDVLHLFTGTTTTFLGQTVDATSILVRYTLIGDNTLDGRITGDDFFRFDTAYHQGTKAYAHGDVNYSGTLDADDAFYLDLNYSRVL